MRRPLLCAFVSLVVACDFTAITFGAVFASTALAGDPHGYAADLFDGRACHALLGRACASDPID